MPKVADYISPEAVKKLATSSNYRLGEEIAKNGKVEFVEFSSLKVIAQVSLPGKSSKRTVEMNTNKNGLNYKCTCSNKQDWFCKHCVAVRIILWEKTHASKNN